MCSPCGCASSSRNLGDYDEFACFTTNGTNYDLRSSSFSLLSPLFGAPFLGSANLQNDAVHSNQSLYYGDRRNVRGEHSEISMLLFVVSFRQNLVALCSRPVRGLGGEGFTRCFPVVW